MRLGRGKLKTTFSFASALAFRYIWLTPNIGCGSEKHIQVNLICFSEPFAIFVEYRMRVVFAMSVYYDCDMKNKPFDI